VGNDRMDVLTNLGSGFGIFGEGMRIEMIEELLSKIVAILKIDQANR